MAFSAKAFASLFFMLGRISSKVSHGSFTKSPGKRVKISEMNWTAFFRLLLVAFNNELRENLTNLEKFSLPAN